MIGALVYLPILAMQPGKVDADTKTYLYLDPGRSKFHAVDLTDHNGVAIDDDGASASTVAALRSVAKAQDEAREAFYDRLARAPDRRGRSP